MGTFRRALSLKISSVDELIFVPGKDLFSCRTNDYAIVQALDSARAGDNIKTQIF